MIWRQPYSPTNAEWSACFGMLCAHCQRFSSCTIVDAMIEMKDGGPWPEGGWVSDPGAGVTCLSYQPAEQKPLTNDQLQRAFARAVPMCTGCAARKGSEASVSLHTQRDFRKAVETSSIFCCHEPQSLGKPCGGWRHAVQAKQNQSATEENSAC